MNEFALKKQMPLKVWKEVQEDIDEVYLKILLPSLDENDEGGFTLEYSERKENCTLSFQWEDENFEKYFKDEKEKIFMERKNIQYFRNEFGKNEILIQIQN